MIHYLTQVLFSHPARELWTFSWWLLFLYHWKAHALKYGYAPDFSGLKRAWKHDAAANKMLLRYGWQGVTMLCLVMIQ
jgi:hypothetical protein